VPLVPPLGGLEVALIEHGPQLLDPSSVACFSGLPLLSLAAPLGVDGLVPGGNLGLVAGAADAELAQPRLRAGPGDDVAAAAGARADLDRAGDPRQVRLLETERARDDVRTNAELAPVQDASQLAPLLGFQVAELAQQPYRLS
jgi:hypothetical protein